MMCWTVIRILLDYEDSIPSEDSDDGSNKVNENLELERTVRKATCPALPGLRKNKPVEISDMLE